MCNHDKCQEKDIWYLTEIKLETYHWYHPTQAIETDFAIIEHSWVQFNVHKRQI